MKTDMSRRNGYLRPRGAPGVLKKPIFGGVVGGRRENTSSGVTRAWMMANEESSSAMSAEARGGVTGDEGEVN